MWSDVVGPTLRFPLLAGDYQVLGQRPALSASYEVTATDLFCGAGGSSSGLEEVPGVRVVMASNHWDKAIGTHNHNFPHVDHDREDIGKVDPRRFPRTDILWASPSCTFWSRARGDKTDFSVEATAPGLFDLTNTSDSDDEPESDDAKQRSRALMSDIPRFAEHHRYRAVIVENVTDLLKWVHFPKWIARMRTIGYKHRVLTINSAFAHQLGRPAPQLRDRVYVAFWLERYPTPDFDRWVRPQAWCPTCNERVTALYAPKDPKKPYGAYWQQYVYRCPRASCRNAIVHPYALPALAAIDMTQPGSRIGDRKKPLQPKTTARIQAGLERLDRWAITLEAAGNTFERRPGVRAWSVDEPLRTVHTTPSKALATLPITVPVEGRDGGRVARPAALPGRTQTGRNETALLVPAGGTWNDTARTAEEPMRTRTTRDTEALFVVPLRNNNRPKTILEPLDTFAANGQHHGLIGSNQPNDGAWMPNMLYAYDAGLFRSLSRPLPTQTTVAGDAVLKTAIDIDDCLFRMLFPDEVKLGMAFAPWFDLLRWSNRDKVRMCGNAVTPPVARDLVAAVVEAITGDEIHVAA